MPWEFDLRDDGDAEVCCVRYDGTDIFTAVVATIAIRSPFVDEVAVLLPPLIPVADGAERSFLRQQGIFLRGEAPATAIDQMPVEAIELVASHLI